MIAHGRKQISEMVYARKASEGGGAVRLTNMIRGGAVVFGELRPFGWLTDATKQAILGAFGVSDGKAVIKATNAYLNVIAATDPTKAQALADYLNSSPENCLGYINPRYLISQTSSKDLLYVYEHAMAINIAVYGGTSAAVSRMQITIDGALVYNKLQSETAYGGTNSGGVDVSGVINTARMNASADWWRVSSRGYVAYNGTCYTDWQQILHIERLNTRQEFDLVGMQTPSSQTP